MFAAHLAHDRQIEQLAHQKALVAGEIGHDDFKEIVRLARDEVARHDFRHLDDGLLEGEGAIVGVAVELDADKDRKPQPTRSRAERRKPRI